MYSSGMEWYAAWKSTDGINTVTADFALETLIKGLLVPEGWYSISAFIFFMSWIMASGEEGSEVSPVLWYSICIGRNKEIYSPYW
jgi:hypothetical protein